MISSIQPDSPLLYHYFVLYLDPFPLTIYFPVLFHQACVCVCVCVYVWTGRERNRERNSERERDRERVGERQRQRGMQTYIFNKVPVNKPTKHSKVQFPMAGKPAFNSMQLLLWGSGGSETFCYEYNKSISSSSPQKFLLNINSKQIAILSADSLAL